MPGPIELPATEVPAPREVSGTAAVRAASTTAITSSTSRGKTTTSGTTRKLDASLEYSARRRLPVSTSPPTRARRAATSSLTCRVRSTSILMSSLRPREWWQRCDHIGSQFHITKPALNGGCHGHSVLDCIGEVSELPAERIIRGRNHQGLRFGTITRFVKINRRRCVANIGVLEIHAYLGGVGVNRHPFIPPVICGTEPELESERCAIRIFQHRDNIVLTTAACEGNSGWRAECRSNNSQVVRPQHQQNNIEVTPTGTVSELRGDPVLNLTARQVKHSRRDVRDPNLVIQRPVGIQTARQILHVPSAGRARVRNRRQSALKTGIKHLHMADHRPPAGSSRRS